MLVTALAHIDSPPYKILIHQLLRSGTAIGASIAEAESAQSLPDFIHKMKIADKEANETSYWISLLDNEFPEITSRLKEPLLEIKRILGSILITSTRKQKQRKQTK